MNIRDTLIAAGNAIQAQINQLTNTTSEERHSKQHREQQACERRLKQMQIKREKEQKRKAMIAAAMKGEK